MKQPVVIIGLGEIGGVFARGFLRTGHPVYPVNRDSGDLDQELTYPALVLVAVGEADLAPVMASLPETWRERIVLLQEVATLRAIARELRDG